MLKITKEEFQEWEDKVFGYGYGSGEMVVFRTLKGFISTLDDFRYDYEKLCDTIGEPSTWLLINILCQHDVIEYGTSPRFGWIDTDHREMITFISEHTVDELYEMLKG